MSGKKSAADRTQTGQNPSPEEIQEQTRLAEEKAEQERKAEQDRIERERLENERLEAERLEDERLERERLERERLEKEKSEREESARIEEESARIEEEKRLEAERLAQAQPKRVQIIAEGVVGHKLLRKGDVTDDPEYVALLETNRGRTLVREV